MSFGFGKPGPEDSNRGGRIGIHRRGVAGFTLIELLVVVAVIGVLASLLLPALAQARVRAVAAACLGHHRQLGISLHLYAGDAQDQLPNNFGATGTREAIESGRFDNWATSLLNWELDASNTNRTWLASGGLGPFLSGGVEVFRCPGDRVLSSLQRQAGWTARGRSVSLNAMMGNAGEFMKGSYNTNNPDYRQYVRLGDVWRPSGLFTLIDEHPDSINDGYFLNRLDRREWVDLPASYHGGAAALSFADGHAETHRWRSASTRRPARPDASQLPFEVPADDGGDFDWLMERTTRSRTPVVAAEN